METLERFEAAHKRGAVDDMRACFHDGALIESVASDGRPLGADATTEAVRAAMLDGVYLIANWQYEELGPGIVLVRTASRHRSARGGVSHEPVFRLTVGRDGLMWRVKLFHSRADALAYFQQHGADIDFEPSDRRGG